MSDKTEKSTVIFLPPRVVAPYGGKDAGRLVSQELNKKLRNMSYEDMEEIVRPLEGDPPIQHNPRMLYKRSAQEQEVVPKRRNLQVQIRKDQLLRIRKSTKGRVSLAEALQRIAEHYLVDRED